MIMISGCTPGSRKRAPRLRPMAGWRAQAACAMCHGTNGLSSMPNAANLAGQPSIYLEEQLKAYRSGKRHHEVMSVIAKSLSDEDILHLSAWYAAMKVSVELPL